MGKINKEIEHYEKEIEKYKELIHLTHVAEMNRKPEQDENKEDKYKQKYCDKIYELRRKVSKNESVLKELCTDRREYGCFYYEDVGKIIADLMTQIEGKKFVFKEVDYHRGSIPSDMYDDDIEPAIKGKVYIVTDKTEDFEICEDDKTCGDFAKDENTILLATRWFNFPSYEYNGKEYNVQRLRDSYNDISFYSNKYQIATKDYDYIYELIDKLIERKAEVERFADPDDYMTLEEDTFYILLGTHERSWLLKKSDYKEAINEIVSKYKKDKPMKLKRKKDE